MNDMLNDNTLNEIYNSFKNKYELNLSDIANLKLAILDNLPDNRYAYGLQRFKQSLGPDNNKVFLTKEYNRPIINDLDHLFEYNHNDTVLTGQALFNAGYLHLEIIAFYAIIAKKVASYLKDIDGETQLLVDIANPGFITCLADTGTSVDFRCSGKAGVYHGIDHSIVITISDYDNRFQIFNNNWDAIFSGSIEVRLLLFTSNDKYYDKCIPLNRVGTELKNHFLTEITDLSI